MEEEEARSGDSAEVVVKSRNASGCLIVRNKRHNSGELLEAYNRKQVFNNNEFGNFEQGEGFRKRRGSEFVERADGRFKLDRGYNGGGSMYAADVSGRSYMAGLSPMVDEEDDIRYRKRRHYDYKAVSEADEDRRLNYYGGDGNRYSNGSHPPGTMGSANFTPREEYIRIQGKNGVLRVKVNKMKSTSFLKAYGHSDGDVRIGSGNENMARRNNRVSPSPLVKDVHIPREQAVVISRADKHIPKTHMLMPANRSRGSELPIVDSGTSLNLGMSIDEDENYSGNAVRDGMNNREAAMNLLSGTIEGKHRGSDGKGKRKLQSLPKESDNGCDSKSDIGGLSLKLGTRSAENHKFDEAGKTDASPLEKCSLTGSKEGKQKRGSSGTEKQKLRENIRKMLLDSGWTIDYRPRRNRDYQDAVYVSPSGTAYWSIVKAYEGLQKQFAKDNRVPEPVGDGSQFSPVADDVLSKLTRQTRKKMEKEMKKKGQNGEGCGNLQHSISKKFAKTKHVAHNAASNEGLTSLINEDHKSLDDMANESSYIENPKTIKKQSRRTLLVRTVNKGLSSGDDMYVPYTGKRTLLSWLVDCGSVKLNEKVQYMNHKQTKALQHGWITRDGIHCLCCSKIVTISKFELHAGGKVRQPLQSIFLESGITLLQCMTNTWNKQTKLEQDTFLQVDVKGDDQNDDICGICGDGGDLICCDGCPSTFHQNCLGVEILPLGEWHCPNCLCNHCGLAADNNALGNGEISSPLLMCNLCEKKYHQSCITGIGSDSYSSSFCDVKCKELFETLQKFVGVKHDLGSGFSWSIVHRTDIKSESSLHDLAAQVESNCKLAVCQDIMDECFLPIVDKRSGFNIIHHVVYNYGSNFNRLNYSKFYTAILDRGDEMISAASLRFHGEMFAEMPFIGTRHIYRHQGMCSRLFSAIEMALRLFKVEKLVIPAIPELMHTWIEVFRFNPITDPDKKKLRSMNILVFPGVDMLQKLLLEQNHLKTVAVCTAAKSSTLDGSPKILINSNKKRPAGTVQDDSDGAFHSRQVTENQEDTSASDSASDSESDSDPSHPTSTLDIPPRISVSIGREDNKDTSKAEGEEGPEETKALESLDKQDAEDEVDISNAIDNDQIAAKRTSFISESPS